MIHQRLAESGLALPALPHPLGAYVPVVRSGNLLFLSGMVPVVDGALPAAYRGKVGAGVSVEDARAAARTCILNALAHIDRAAGLAQIIRIVRLTGFVNAVPDFTAHPQVLNAASELLVQLFREDGRHARSAVGAGSLPLDACVELELVVEVQPA